jgi:MFS transporter, DHA3 family, macrolide efflux protein
MKIDTRLRDFYLLTGSQVLSLIGSRMTSTAIGIWLYEKTGQTTALLLVAVFQMLPSVVAGSLAGVISDRSNRRKLLMVVEVGQALGSIVLFLDFISSSFQVWHLYAITLYQALFLAVQEPTTEASITMLIPDEYRDRANGIRQAVYPAAGMIAPIVTGFVYAFVRVSGVILVDITSFIVAVIILWRITIPQPQKAEKEEGAKSGFVHELLEGFRFLKNRPVLLSYVLYATAINFFFLGPIELATPYIISLIGSRQWLGILLGVMNLGPVVGGLIMGAWGGFNSRVNTLFFGSIMMGCTMILYGLARSPIALGAILFVLIMPLPIYNGAFFSMVQLKVPPDMQGRVFALLMQLSTFAIPLSLVVTGQLVDHVLEPAVGTSSWEPFAPIWGDQKGAGMGLLITGFGFAFLLLSLAVHLHPRVRTMEADLPSYETEADGQPQLEPA